MCDVDLRPRSRGNQDKLTTNGSPGSVHLQLVLAKAKMESHFGSKREARTSMSMVIFRFTESIYTSLEGYTVNRVMLFQSALGFNTYNSSRHLIGDPIASHSDSNKQIWEKDFSPPDSVFAPRPSLVFVMSGSTCDNLVNDAFQG
jgi:hypothetical protein